MTIPNRRDFLRKSVGTLGAASAAAMLPLSIRNALAVEAAVDTGTIQDVKHIVILMQENRSFDHYFGTLSGVAGFSDPNALPGVFEQHGYEPGVGVTAAGYTQPFNLQNNPPTENGYDTNTSTTAGAASTTAGTTGR